MAGELVWIIDEEWPDYQVEEELLARELPDARIRHSTYDYEADLKAFGCRADIILAQIYVPLPVRPSKSWNAARELRSTAAVMTGWI